MTKFLAEKPRYLVADKFLLGAKPPPGIKVEYLSTEPREAGRLASDLAYVNGEWLDLEHWRYWIGHRRPRDNAKLMAPEAIVSFTEAFVSPDNQIVTAAGRAIRSPYLGSGAYFEPIPAEEVVAEYNGTYGTALLRAVDYGHWLMHRIPRIATLTEHAPGVPFLHSQINDTGVLARFGLTEDDVVRFPRSKKSTWAYVENLLVPSHLSRPGHQRVQDIHRLDRVVRQFTEGIVDDPTLPELLYVARRPDDRRSGASNKDEMQEYFESLGFVTWYPIDDPIERQIQHFRAARVVVSEIGSQGLTSMFAGPDTTVIIITPAKSKGLSSQRVFRPTWRQWQRVVCEARFQGYAQIVAATDTAYRSFDVDMDILTTAMESYPLRTW